MRLIKIPDDGFVRIPIMYGDISVGEKRIDLSHLPTIDAEPVIRCQDCEYYKPHHREIEGETWLGLCLHGGIHTDDLDFCSRAKRRTGNGATD